MDTTHPSGDSTPRSQPEPTMTAWLGIDVSKNTLDVCLLKANGRQLKRIFPNSPAGHAKLVRWVEQQTPLAEVHFCMEATGSYSEGVARYLAEREHHVSVVNGFRTKYYGLAKGTGNKTDGVDARLLAEYCCKEQPPLWRNARPEVRLLTALIRRREVLMEQVAAERNRLQQPELFPQIARSLKANIASLNRQIAQLEQQIGRHIGQDPGLREDAQLLQSIDGIGETTARCIMAFLPDVTQFASAASAAAFGGLNPRRYQSGTSVLRKTRLSKRGCAELRKALYLPAMTAARWNPVCRDLHQRLIARGLKPKAALGAVMRKLLMLAYGVLKSRRPFDPQISLVARTPATA
jgi:transposase